MNGTHIPTYIQAKYKKLAQSGEWQGKTESERIQLVYKTPALTNRERSLLISCIMLEQ